MKEKHHTARVLAYARDHFPESCAIEIKLARNGSVAFKSLAEHQRNALLLASSVGIYFKIPDCGWQNPFDGFVLKRSPAYIAIIFGDKVCYVEISVWRNEEAISKRKSLTFVRARDIARYTIEI